MAELVRDFITAFGPFLGPTLLFLTCGMAVSIRLTLRNVDRHAGLCYYLADLPKGEKVTLEGLIKYGALDDPRAGASRSLKGVIS